MPSPYREIEDNICYLMGRPEASSIDKVELSAEIVDIAHRLNAHNSAIERVEFIMGNYVEYFHMYTHTYIHTYIQTYIHTDKYILNSVYSYVRIYVRYICMYVCEYVHTYSNLHYVHTCICKYQC